MSLPLKPHTITVSVASVPVDADLQALPPAFALPVTVSGLMTVKDSDAAIKATNMDIRAPHKWMCDVDHAALFAVGNKVVWNGKTLYVAAPPVLHESGLAGDHVSVMLTGESLG